MENKTTFWKFIQNNKIEIPIIQRDYAQGREGKEYIRNTFLETLKKALDSDDEQLKLDFVYGSNESYKLNPLDGQQRLTTLWLLHWYIALKAGQLTDDVAEILNNFSYETRISSREFCQELCKTENFSDYKDCSIVDFIQNQTWFYSAWKQDPTIQAMLRMLKGTKISDKKGNDICDGIEEFFDTTSKETFETYWKKLTESEVIIFYYLPLQDFGLSDDLYIKMNARGKQLTNFENFKADLIGYIEQNAKEDKEWEKFLDTENGIPIKLDTTWTDIFWKNRSEDNRIDEIYFAFFNRYFLNDFIANSENAEKCENDKIFKFLYGKTGDDSEVAYSVFDNYKWSSLNLLNKISNVLDRVYRLDKAQLAILNKFDFIPTYKEYRSVSTLTQAQRVKFFAIGAYFANGDFDETSFLRWMRVANNLIDNADIDNVPNMISHIKLIDELSKGSHSIYEHLTAENFSVQSNASSAQLEEEIIKAKLILNDTAKWKDRIEKLENHGYFTGQIRFVFNWLGNEPNVTQFDEYSKVMKLLFGNADVSDEIGKNGKHCFQRALLCFDENGNFATLRGANYSFLIGKRDESYSWKKFLLDAERSQYLKSLVDEICNEYNCDVSAENLENIINSCKSKIKNWRKFFIDYPAVWSYMEQKNIRWHRDSGYNIDLVKRERCGEEVDHAELRAYCLYLDFLDDTFLSVYEPKFWYRDRTCAYFDIINKNGKNIALNIYFDVEKAIEKESEDCYRMDVFYRDEQKPDFKFNGFEWNEDIKRYRSECYSKVDAIKKIKEILNQISK